jgi:hypothetical protein
VTLVADRFVFFLECLKISVRGKKCLQKCPTLPNKCLNPTCKAFMSARRTLACAHCVYNRPAGSSLNCECDPACGHSCPPGRFGLVAAGRLCVRVQPTISISLSLSVVAEAALLLRARQLCVCGMQGSRARCLAGSPIRICLMRPTGAGRTKAACKLRKCVLL